MGMEKVILSGLAKCTKCVGHTRPPFITPKLPEVINPNELRLCPNFKSTIGDMFVSGSINANNTINILNSTQHRELTIIRKLMDIGVKETDAKILIKVAPEKELLENLQMFKQEGHLNTYIKEVLKEYNSVCEKFGRTLNFGGLNKFESVPNTFKDINIMQLTSKLRANKMFNRSELKCKCLPEGYTLTEEDKVAKSIIDNHFNTINGTKYDMFQYRGEVLSRDLPYTRNIEHLKEGDIFEMPGYIWTTDDEAYAFANYADANMEYLKYLNRIKIKYHILCPKNTKILASRSRLGQEFIMPCDSTMRLAKKIYNEENRELIIYCEHIPKVSRCT